MIKDNVLKIKKWFINRFKKKATIISCLISIITFSLVFITGILSNKTKDEKCACYFSQIALNHTVNRGDKNLVGLLVEPKADSGASMEYDTQKEINNIWGAFKGENTSFAPVINANKEIDIHFAGDEGAKYSSNNLSILYSSVGDSTEVYHTKKVWNEETKKEESIPVDYKFQCSPLAAMFPSSRDGMQPHIYIYISQKQAENKLKKEGIEINEDSLRSLLNTTVDIDFNGKLRTCIIHNIYLDNFEHEYMFPNSDKKYNYYYGTDVGAILGDYIFISTYALQFDVFPKELVKQGMYFMGEYSYRNRFYLEYAKDYYSPTDYLFKYATSNLKEDFIPDESVLQVSIKAGGSSFSCTLLTTLLALMFVGNLLFVFLFKLYTSPLSITLVGVSSILPYLLFKAVFVITKNVSIFSSYSTVLNMVFLIFFSSYIFVLFLFSKALRKKEGANV